MANDLDALAIRFCKALAADTGTRPMQWRSIVPIGIRARIRDEKERSAVVAHAVAAGWLEVEGGHSVMLTDAGRRL